MTYLEAKSRLERMVAASDDPALGPLEITELLLLARTVDSFGAEIDPIDLWTPASAYAVGDLVVPRQHNGHYYEVTVSDGLAGANEPSWPLGAGATVVLDGITYTELGATAWGGEWDLQRAAAEGWRWKAGKCSSRFNFSSDVNNFQRSQTFEHCIKMAKEYESDSAYTINVGGASVYDPVIGNLNGGN